MLQFPSIWQAIPIAVQACFGLDQEAVECSVGSRRLSCRKDDLTAYVRANAEEGVERAV